MKTKFIKSIKKDCFNQNRFVYKFDKKIDETFIGFLKFFGRVKVFRDFDIPLIIMDVPNKMRLNSLFHSNKIDVFFKEKCSKDYVLIFEKKLNEFL